MKVIFSVFSCENNHIHNDTFEWVMTLNSKLWTQENWFCWLQMRLRLIDVYLSPYFERGTLFFFVSTRFIFLRQNSNPQSQVLKESIKQQQNKTLLRKLKIIDLLISYKLTNGNISIGIINPWNKKTLDPFYMYLWVWRCEYV